MRLSLTRSGGVKVALICYSLLGLLTIIVMAEGPVSGVDVMAARLVENVADGASRRLWLWITALGGSATVVPVMLVISLMLWREGRLRLVPAQWGCFLLARMVTDGLKYAIGRERPPMTDIELLLAGATNHAFPSGHATSASYVYGLLILLMWRSSLPRTAAWICGAALCAVIAAIALSRIVLGVHFASDVVGGLLSGGAALALASALIGNAKAR